MGNENDPTRLDPPIEVTQHVCLSGAASYDARAHLRKLWDPPAGEAVSEEWAAAEVDLLDVHPVRLLLTHVDADGRPTFALAPPS